MNPKTIDRNLSVSEQIASQDIAAIASAGFKSVICNRPDGEGADQPVFAEIETAARAAGLAAAYLPIVSGKVCDDDAPAFGVLIDRAAEAGLGLLPDRNPFNDAVVAFGRRSRTPIAGNIIGRPRPPATICRV